MEFRLTTSDMIELIEEIKKQTLREVQSARRQPTSVQDVQKPKRKASPAMLAALAKARAARGKKQK